MLSGISVFVVVVCCYGAIQLQLMLRSYMRTFRVCADGNELFRVAQS